MVSVLGMITAAGIYVAAYNWCEPIILGLGDLGKSDRPRTLYPALRQPAAPEGHARAGVRSVTGSSGTRARRRFFAFADFAADRRRPTFETIQRRIGAASPAS